MTSTATTNGARFQAEVLLDLLRASRARDPDGPPLFIGHAEWFAAYLERTGLRPESAPLFIRLAHEYGQDLEVDGRADRVIERVVEGPVPLLAANVTIGWPMSGSKRNRYSYEDTLAVPDLQVTNERLITYRLLDYGDMVAYDEIEGLLGSAHRGFSRRALQPDRRGERPLEPDDHRLRRPAGFAGSGGEGALQGRDAASPSFPTAGWRKTCPRAGRT